MKIRLIAAVAALVFGLQTIPASATTLSLDTGKSLVLNPGTSGSMTFSFTNNPGDINDNFLAYTLGIQVLPAGVVSGTVTLGTLTQPVTNPMPIGTLDFTQPTLATLKSSGTINGTTNFYNINAATTTALGTVLGSTSYNLGTLGFTASGGAAGTWNVYVIQQGGADFQSYWTDGSILDSDFGNLPRGAGNSSLLVGTITAVPEPGSLAVAGVAGMMAMGCVWGRRRKAKARAAAADASISA
jgi:hypothetical protein